MNEKNYALTEKQLTCIIHALELQIESLSVTRKDFSDDTRMNFALFERITYLHALVAQLSRAYYG
jgi:hypothetical protein